MQTWCLICYTMTFWSLFLCSLAKMNGAKKGSEVRRASKSTGAKAVIMHKCCCSNHA